MTVLVTGAGGYLGGCVLDALSQAHLHPVALLRKTGAVSAPGVPVEYADLGDAAAVRAVMQKYHPSAIVHCAASIPTASTLEEETRSEHDNLLATRVLLAAASEHAVRHIVFTSSISVYTGKEHPAGHDIREDEPVAPEGFYGKHKLMAEELCRDWASAEPGRTCTVLRLAGLHGNGRRSGVVNAFLTRALAGQEIRVASPLSRYAVLHVSDAARAVTASLSVPARKNVRVLNIGGQPPMTLQAMAESIVRASGGNSPVIAGGDPSVDRVLAVDAALHELGFEPTPFEAWIRWEVENRLPGDGQA